LSDQAAMVLPGQGELVSVTLDASALDTSSARRMAFPEALKILVINSYTERSLSGAALVDYTRNRFAYSLAMAIVQQELRAQGVRGELAASLNRLSRLSPTALREIGGARALFDLLRRIPESIGIAELRSRYDLPQLDQAYDQYFGTVPEKLRPDTIGLRGPLLFGIAESERARVFPATLQAGDYATAGILMSTGHDGDRRVKADGSEYRYDLSDAALDALAARDVPIEFCPGCYGASSPVLDALVDAALEAGALGASLTGAGIAGTVLALCRAEDADRIATAIRCRLSAPDYAALARRAEPLTETEAGQAVVVNAAPAPAGELTLP
jgi:galactokinase